MTALSTTVSLLLAATTVTAQQNGDIRLTGYEHSQRFGRLDLFLNGSWGSVCNEGFDFMDANVACRQMGLGLAMDVVTSELLHNRFGYLPQGAPIHVKELQCKGKEKHLLNCAFSTDTTGCSLAKVVEMSCSNFRPQPTPGDIRLVGGRFPSHGILEVYYDGSWQRPCSDGFEGNASNAVCTQLGYTESINYTLTTRTANVSAMSWTSCSSSATCATSCISLSKREGNCSVNNSLAITCSHSSTSSMVTTATSCKIENSVPGSGSLRFNNSSSSNQGRLEVFNDTTWSTICGLDDEHFPTTSGHVACRLLGFVGVETVHRNSQDLFGIADTEMGVHRMLCKGGEEKLMQCVLGSDRPPVCNNSNAVGLTCSTDYDLPPYGAITLNGSGGASGGLSVYNGSLYEPVCDSAISQTEADVACRQLGYERAREIVRNSYIPNTEPSVLSNISCQGQSHDSASLLSCEHSRDLDSFCTKDEYVGLHCLTNESEDDPSNNIRLAAGNVTAGVIEVHIEGQWRTAAVCSYDLMPNVAHVACRQLGFHGAYSFGNGTKNDSEDMSSYTIGLGDCHGHENSLEDCSHRAVFESAPFCQQSVFVSCKNQSDYPYGALRLCPDMSVDCQDKRQLEVFKFDRWEHVCFTGFDDEVALVACRELGYVNVTSVKKVPLKVIPLYNIRIFCTGNESRLIDCRQTLDGCTDAIRLECTNDTTSVPTRAPSNPKTYIDVNTIGIAVGVSLGIFLLLMVAILIVLVTLMVRRCIRRRKREAEQSDWLPNTSTNIDMNFHNPRFEEPASAPVYMKGVPQSPPPVDCSYA